MYDNYVKTESCREVVRRFGTQFPDVGLPNRDTVRRLVNRFRETGSVLDKKPKVTKRVLTEEKIHQIGERLEQTPTKSLRRLAQETGVSKASALRATKLLGLKPYRITVVHELRPRDPEMRLRFCNWMLQNVNNGIIDPCLIWFTDEAWFHLNGYVLSQNNRYWSHENPHRIHEIPLHDERIGVWCAVNGFRIIGPIFFNNTINAARYRDDILTPFFEELTDIDCRNGYFQQDSATAHTAQDSLKLISEIFEDRVISAGLWPSRSPDLTACDFHLWGYLKNKVYARNPHTLDDLKDYIRTEINSITEQQLMRVNEGFLKRCRKCVEVGGEHFQHLLS